jgi:SSS family solute:Na+ symporter
MFVAPLLAGQESIFAYLQDMNGIYFIPIFSVVVVGMLHPRVPSRAAFWALVLGLVLMSGKYFIPGVGPAVDRVFVYNFHYLGFVFALLVVFMVVWGAVAPRPQAWKLVNTTPIDMTPWKNAKWASALLILMVLGIYAFFAA